MAYLIDGSNLLGFLFPDAFRESASKHSLAARLALFQKQKRSKVILIFDGPPDANLERRYLPRPKFVLRFPEPGDDADEIIKEMIDKQTDTRRFFVVSSDREIKEYARAHRAKILSCEAFAKEMKKTLKEYRNTHKNDKKPEFPTPFEVRQWEEIFREKDD
ncbi:MAG: NYN domain-containing protein [Candidatus Aminicenantes bacterium]|nr:NYN domain-containing protein [Candidatus Aminicenantes bacterium]